MTKTRGKFEISKIIKFIMNFRGMRMSISQELQEMHYHDKFQAIKNPLSWFRGAYDSNDVNRFTRRLLNGFRSKYQKVTRNLPIKHSLFDYIIDDSLFERYFNETQSTAKHTTNFNYQREYAINHSNHEMKMVDMNDFVFSLIFLKKVIIATNGDGLSYAKFLLNLLNLLSFWFNLSVISLPIYLTKIWRLFAGRSSVGLAKSSER